MIPFREFIINESLKPLETEYGWFDEDLNFIKNKIKVSKYYIKTAFKNDDSYYVVYFNLYENEGELNFSYIKNLNDVVNKGSGGTTMEPTETKNVSTIFNKVFYLALILLNKLDELGSGIKSIEYSGSSAKLNKLYKFIFNNKQFLDEVDKYGFKPIESDGVIFKFVKE